MKNLPLVSFIIPTYNRAHIIAETLDSIKAQSYPHWECIVVDDGSTDGTEALISQYIQNDSRFRFIVRPEERKGGGSAARNFGFEKSAGDFINFLDSDDLIHQDKLKLQLAVFEKNKSCQVCLCEADIFNETDRYQKESIPLDRMDFFEDYILRKLDIGTNQPLWKKNFLAASDILYDESLLKAQDYDFFSRMSFRKDFSYCVVKMILVSVRIGSSDRIKLKGHNTEGIVSQLTAYFKTNLLLINGNNEKLYKEHTNVFLQKILNNINSSNINIALEFLKKINRNVFNNDPKYKKHFKKIIVMVSLLKLTGFRGYSILKKYYFLD